MQQYLELITRHNPPNAFFGISAINPDRSIKNFWFQTPELARALGVIQFQSKANNVYMRLTAVANPIKSGRGLERDSLGSSVLWADFDAYTHRDTAIDQLRSYPIPPTAIVNSGNGLHAYWSLNQFVTDIWAIKAANKAIIEYFNALSGTETGDSCYDLARVLRVVGTSNFKHDPPLITSFIDYDPNRVYSIDQFDKAELTPTFEKKVIWDCVPLPIDFLDRIKDKTLRKRITSEQEAIKVGADVTAQGTVDRSRNDAYITIRLLSLGYLPEQILSVLTDPIWLSGDKYRTTGRYDYPVMTVHKMLDTFQHSPTRFFADTKLQPDRVVNELADDQPFLFVGEHIYRYHQGVYVPNAEHWVKKKLVELLGPNWTARGSDEVVRRISDQHYIETSEVNKHIGYVNVRNGMLDLETGQLLPHNQGYNSLIQIPATYDPTVTSAELDTFLAAIMPEDAIPVFWEYIGSCFLLNRYWPKAFVTLVGPPDSGKSKVLEWLQRFLGVKNTTSISLQTLADHKFASADLFGRIANIFSDLDESEAQNTGQIKALTGDDPTIYAERKFKEPFTFKSTARLIFSANHFPTVRSPDEAFFKRALIIPCDNVFTRETANPHIVDDLSTDQVFSAALNRAYEGLRRALAQNGLSLSTSISKANLRFRFSADTVAGFLDACTRDPSAVISKQKLYQCYVDFVRGDNRKAVTKEGFFRRVTENAERFGIGETYSKRAGTDDQVWCFTGITPPNLNLENFVIQLGAN